MSSAGFENGKAPLSGVCMDAVVLKPMLRFRKSTFATIVAVVVERVPGGTPPMYWTKNPFAMPVKVAVPVVGTALAGVSTPAEIAPDWKFVDVVTWAHTPKVW